MLREQDANLHRGGDASQPNVCYLWREMSHVFWSLVYLFSPRRSCQGTFALGDAAIRDGPGTDHGQHAEGTVPFGWNGRSLVPWMTGNNGASRGVAGVFSFLKAIDSDALFTFVANIYFLFSFRFYCLLSSSFTFVHAYILSAQTNPRN